MRKLWFVKTPQTLKNKLCERNVKSMSTLIEEDQNITKKGYTSIGSFHSASTKELFESSTLLPFPFPQREKQHPHVENSAFGTALLKKEQFLIDSKWCFLNHAAFGAVNKRAFALANQWRQYVELQPLRFIDRELFPFMIQSIKELAKFIQTDPEDLVLIPNATTGLNAVIQSVNITNPNDSIFCLNVSYGSTKAIIKRTCESKGCRMVEGEIGYLDSQDDEKILELVDDLLPTANCKLAIFDHITSNTATVFPVKKLVELCRSRGIPVLIDGAHSLLNLDLRIDDIKPDFYVGNCHKWFCSPKGSAYMYVCKSKQIEIRPLIVSHGYFNGFQDSFLWNGLSDFSPLLTVGDTISFWESIGVYNTRCYMHKLIDRAVKILEDEWNTKERVNDLPDHKKCAMRLVKLPQRVFNETEKLDLRSTSTSTEAKLVQDTLYFKHQIEVPVKCIEGSLYVRVSGHIYNNIEEYRKLSKVIKRV